MTNERFEQIKVVYAEWCMLHPGEWDICTAPSQEWEQFYRSRGVTWEEMDMCEFDLCDTDLKDPEYAKRKAEERGLEIAPMADDGDELPFMIDCAMATDATMEGLNDERPWDEPVGCSIADIAYDIIGCAYESHNWYKAGCNERVYEVGMLIELHQSGYDADKQVPLPVYYKGEETDVTLRMDIVVSGTAVGNVIVELKAMPHVDNAERLQLWSYMRQTQTRYGLLINFSTSVYSELWELQPDSNTCTPISLKSH